MLEFKGYIEEVDNFYFREKASIQIPKTVRERAFSLRLDIEIVSIAKEVYRNFSSVPAHSFYGYAVLVMRDHSEIQIPINQSRQTLYFEKLYEAYTNWYALHFWLNQREFSRGLADVLGDIGGAVGLGTPVVPIPPCPIWSGFEEIQLRDAYVKTPFGTTFKLEVSYQTPVVQNGDTDCSYDGKSLQVDGDKDLGLPPASAPQIAESPDSPYDGFPPPTSPEDLGNYRNLKDEDSLNSPNPDNAPTPQVLYYQVALYYRSILNCGANGIKESLAPVGDLFTEPPTFSLNRLSLSTVCTPNDREFFEWYVNGVKISPAGANAQRDSPSLSVFVWETPQAPEGLFYSLRDYNP